MVNSKGDFPVSLVWDFFSFFIYLFASSPDMTAENMSKRIKNPDSPIMRSTTGINNHHQQHEVEREREREISKDISTSIYIYS